MQNRSGPKLILALIFISLLGGLQGIAQQSNGQLEHLSTYRLPKGDPLLGGISAVEVYDEGRSLILLSDRGAWTMGQITRNQAGQIEQLELSPMQVLRDTKGEALKKPFNDSEGLALGADGALYVSFEGQTRVARYDGLDQPAQELPRHEAFKGFPQNGGPEALAIDAQGRLFTLPEDPKTADLAVFILEDDRWRYHYDLPRRGEFLPVGADFGPDGRLYLLERAFYGLGGFASRIRAFTLSAKGATAEETLWTTGRGQYDNLEGISVWQDGVGDIRLTLVSDNNFLFLLSHEIVELRLNRN